MTELFQHVFHSTFIFIISAKFLWYPYLAHPLRSIYNGQIITFPATFNCSCIYIQPTQSHFKTLPICLLFNIIFFKISVPTFLKCGNLILHNSFVGSNFLWLSFQWRYFLGFGLGFYTFLANILWLLLWFVSFCIIRCYCITCFYFHPLLYCTSLNTKATLIQYYCESCVVHLFFVLQGYH